MPRPKDQQRLHVTSDGELVEPFFFDDVVASNLALTLDNSEQKIIDPVGERGQKKVERVLAAIAAIIAATPQELVESDTSSTNPQTLYVEVTASTLGKKSHPTINSWNNETIRYFVRQLQQHFGIEVAEADAFAAELIAINAADPDFLRKSIKTIFAPANEDNWRAPLHRSIKSLKPLNLGQGYWLHLNAAEPSPIPGQNRHRLQFIVEARTQNNPTIERAFAIKRANQLTGWREAHDQRFGIMNAAEFLAYGMNPEQIADFECMSLLLEPTRLTHIDDFHYVGDTFASTLKNSKDLFVKDMAAVGINIVPAGVWEKLQEEIKRFVKISKAGRGIDRHDELQKAKNKHDELSLIRIARELPLYFAIKLDADDFVTLDMVWDISEDGGKALIEYPPIHPALEEHWLDSQWSPETYGRDGKGFISQNIFKALTRVPRYLRSTDMAIAYPALFTRSGDGYVSHHDNPNFLFELEVKALHDLQSMVGPRTQSELLVLGQNAEYFAKVTKKIAHGKDPRLPLFEQTTVITPDQLTEQIAEHPQLAFMTDILETKADVAALINSPIPVYAMVDMELALALDVSKEFTNTFQGYAFCEIGRGELIYHYSARYWKK